MSLKNIFLFGFCLLLFQGCASRSPKPIVNSEFKNNYTSAITEKDHSIACAKIRSIKNAHEQSLVNEILLVREFERCSAIEAMQTPPIRPALSKYFSETIHRTQKQILEGELKNKNLSNETKKELQIELSNKLLKISESEKNFKSKELLIQQALEIANQSKDERQIQVCENQLKINSPRLFSATTPEQMLLAANDFRQWRFFQKAANLYQKILQSEAAKELKLQAAKNLRLNFKTEQNKEKYLFASKQLWQLSEKLQMPSSVQLDQLLTYSRTLWTEDRAKESEKLLLANIPKFQQKTSLHELYWVLAKINEERKNTPETLKYLELSQLEFSKYPNKKQDFKDKILWTKAWFLWKSSDITNAAKLFEELATESTDTGTQIRSLFWLSRAQERLHKTAERTQSLRKLQSMDPLGYYGLLSFAELNEPIPLLKQNPEPRTLSELPDEIRALIELDETNAAEIGLNEFVQNLKKQNSNNTDQWQAVFLGYAQAGLYMPLFANLTNLPVDVKDKFLTQHPEFVFPTPWKDQVFRSSQKSNIPAEMIYAIMRQESAFNPLARSPVDAFGLMQLLPSVAEKIARSNQIPYQSTEDLYRPEIIIPLGAFELKSGFTRTKNSWIKTVAGYNAAATVVDSWLKTRNTTDGITFIEDIPYDETRTYLKLVLRNQIFYQRMFATESFLFPIQLVELK